MTEIKCPHCGSDGRVIYDFDESATVFGCPQCHKCFLVGPVRSVPPSPQPWLERAGIFSGRPTDDYPDGDPLWPIDDLWESWDANDNLSAALRAAEIPSEQKEEVKK